MQEEKEHRDTGPEVFETSDVDSVHELAAPEEVSDDVDRNVLNPQRAKLHFEHNVITDTVDVADFLGTLARGGLFQSGYTVRRTNETASQKLARIQAELEELKKEKVHDNEVDRLTLDLENLLEDSQPVPTLHGERLRTVFKKLNAQLANTQKVPASLTTATYKKADAEVLELEKRLCSLEDIVGVSDLQSAKSVRNHINDLSRKVDVLYDPEFNLAHIKGEIKNLSKEMDELNAKRRLAHLTQNDVSIKPSIPFDTKVDSIYEVLPAIENTITIVPHLVSRLKTLHQVHADMAHSVSAVSELDKTIESIQLDMKSWSDNLDQVNSAIDVHTALFAQNKVSVEKKFTDLEKRLSELKN